MRAPAVPVEIRDRWDGPRWRWWSLVAGILLLLATFVIGTLVALILGQDVIAFILLLLIAEILGISAVGSGLLDSATRTMNRGGLAREGADVDSRQRSAREAWTGDPEDLIRRRRTAGRQAREDKADEEDNTEESKSREQEEQDQRTIRSALIVLPVFVAFVVLLFQL